MLQARQYSIWSIWLAHGKGSGKGKPLDGQPTTALALSWIKNYVAQTSVLLELSSVSNWSFWPRSVYDNSGRTSTNSIFRRVSKSYIHSPTCLQHCSMKTLWIILEPKCHKVMHNPSPQHWESHIAAFYNCINGAVERLKISFGFITLNCDNIEPKSQCTKMDDCPVWIRPAHKYLIACEVGLQ